MKRFLVLMLTMVLILSLVACGSENHSDAITGKDGNPTQQTDSAIENSDPNNDNTAAPTGAAASTSNQDDVKAFEPNRDLEVITAFIYGNDTYVVVENVGERAVLNYRIAYISFDKNGFVATKNSDGCERGKADTVNIMPGNKDLSGWFGADGDYAVAVIVGVDYADGTSWDAENTQIDRWAETASKEFSVDAYRASIVALKEQGALGETNEYAALTDFSLKHGNRFADKNDFREPRKICVKRIKGNLSVKDLGEESK